MAYRGPTDGLHGTYRWRIAIQHTQRGRGTDLPDRDSGPLQDANERPLLTRKRIDPRFVPPKAWREERGPKKWPCV